MTPEKKGVALGPPRNVSVGRIVIDRLEVRPMNAEFEVGAPPLSTIAGLK
jgi:hypothetical protein